MGIEQKPDTRVICTACDGTGWSRSARGRCQRCKGSCLVEPLAPGEKETSASPIPELGKEPVVHRGPKPPHIARAVLVAQRDVREKGGAQRTSQMADGSSYSSAEEILSLGGDALLGVGVISSVDHVEPQLEPGGGRRLAVTLLLEHPESGEVWERVIPVAVAVDSEHTLAQSEFAAATSAHAYFLVRVLAMPRGYRDEEVLARERERATRPDDGAKVLQKPASDSQADTLTVLLADVAAARTVAELTGVEARSIKAIKNREIRRDRDERQLTNAISERRLAVTANDANRAAEGAQRGEAA